MLGTVNRSYNAAKSRIRNDELIVESALEMDEDELLEELETGTDPDSIPDEVMKNVDAALDRIIGGGIDDDEIEDMIGDEDFDEDEISDEDLDLALVEAAGAWLDDEGIGHPNVDRRCCNSLHQPIFNEKKSVVDTENKEF
jgi:hypothetical protein